MKKTIFLLLSIFTITAFSQVVDYDAAGLLFSQENIKGTARYTAMSGAFGALGGNVSAVNVNPAGLTVFNSAAASVTLSTNSLDSKATFYNNTTNSSDDNFELSQAGAVLVFENENNYWNKFAVGINFTMVNNFGNNYLFSGNSPFLKFNEDPYLNADADIVDDIFYNNVDSQKMSTISNGSNDKVTFSIAGKYDDTISYGLSVNTHTLDYHQITKFNELGNDGNTNTIDTQLDQELLVNGEGININLGILAKIKNLRLGVAYQTPTWYSFSEEFYEDSSSIMSNTTDEYLTEFSSVFDYEVRTPSKVTASLAYIFDKQGLLSIDYTIRDFNNLKLKPNSEFSELNDGINDSFQNTATLKIGGEYRYKNLSFRAGYHTATNPIKSIDTNTNGYSLGFGLSISEYTKLDFAYDQTTSANQYQFIDGANPATIDITNNKVTATLTFGL